MRGEPILLIGGSGIVGRRTAGILRDWHPTQPLLIGGRDRAKAERAAAMLAPAEGVEIRLDEADLGLGDRAVAAVMIFLKDDTLAALRFAQARGVPHVSISSGTFEVGPEVSAFIHRPQAAPVLLGSQWLAGAAVLPTLQLAADFARINSIEIAAVLDEQDIGGPAAEIDLDRLTNIGPAALTRIGGRFVWRSGDEAKTKVSSVDGVELDAFAYSPLDIVSLAAATDAPDIRFDIAVGESASRRRGGQMSTEILIAVAGTAADGSPRRARRTIVHPEGQAPLTALGVAMALERLTAIDGRPAPSPGLYLPELLIDPADYMTRLAAIGATVTDLGGGQ